MFSLNNLKNQMPTETASTLFSAYASFATVMMVARSVAKELIPAPFRSYIYSALSYLFNPLFSRELTLVIDENSGMTRNQVYDAAVVYLRTKIGPDTERLRVGKAPRKKTITVAIDKDEELTDTYENVKLKWSFLTKTKTFGKNDIQEKHYFELKFNKKHKDKVMNFYLPFVLARADAMKAEEKVVKLYTRHIWCRGGGEWGSVNLEHPSTFETMAMDSEMKKMIVEDLERFVGRKEFYKKVGKAWKRGYLLYGPPGTGKSSLIAAMANFLKFDVYDLELTSIYSDSQLKRVLLSTTNRSILVLEDIDCCTVDVRNRGSDSGSDSDSDDSKVTLSGLLNFIDGLWSSCGDERIIVFTTNHKDRLDPALLRPGRMDVHIHMSYCTTSGFKILASNYLGIQDNNRHPLCEEIEGLIESKKATPAEVAEELMKSDDADVALQGLVNMLKCKKVEEEEKTAPIKKQRGIKQIASKLKLHLPWIKS